MGDLPDDSYGAKMIRIRPGECSTIIYALNIEARDCRRQGCSILANKFKMLAKKKVTVAVESKPSIRQTLDAVVQQLDRKEWSPDTLDSIAELLRAGGFKIREVAGG